MRQISENRRGGGARSSRRCRRDPRAGASLVIVACVSAFLVAFALAMAYTAGLLLSQANQRIRQERSYQLARSCAQALGQELLQGDKPQALGSVGGFYDFACKFLEDDHYADYNPDHLDTTVYHYAAASPAEGYGEYTIAMYKENLLETGGLTGEFTYDAASGQDPLDVAAGKISRYILTVQVTAENDGIRYTYTTSYSQQSAYGEQAVIFTAPDGTQLRWKRDWPGWVNIQTGAVYTTDLSGQPIRYEIRPGLQNLESCRFTKTLLEKGEKEQPPGGGTEVTP